MLQRLIYKLRVILSGPSIFGKLFILLTMIFLYLLLFGSLYYLLRSLDFGKGPSDWIASLGWATKHLIDPGFIADDMDEKSLPIILLGVISILFGLLCFMVVLLTTVHDLGARFLRKVSHGMLPPHLNGHLIIIGHSDQIITYFENESLLTDLFQETDEVVFVLTNEGALKSLSEYDMNKCHLFEITESDLRMGHSDLQAESAGQVILLEGHSKDMGLRIRFIDQILEERLKINDGSLTQLKLVVESSSHRSEEIIYTLISSPSLSDAKVDLQVIDHTKTKARSFLLEQRLERAVYTTNAQPLMILIDGWSRLSAEVIRQTRSFGLYSPEYKTQIVLLYRTQKEKLSIEESVTDFLGEINDELYYKDLGISQFKYLHTDDLEEQLDSHHHSALLVSSDDDNTVIAHVLDWLDQPICKTKYVDNKPIESTLKVYADVSDESPYRYDKYTGSKLRFKLCPSRANATRTVIRLDAIPRVTHNHYLQKTEEANKREKDEFGEYKKSTHRPWDLLTQEVKDWNRSTADHLGIKLAYIAHTRTLALPELDDTGHFISLDDALLTLLGDLITTYDNARTRSLETHIKDEKEVTQLSTEKYETELAQSDLLKLLEELAIWEHDRWSSERYINGWKYGKSGRRKHSSLVIYQELNEGMKAYDRDNIIEQIRFRVDTFMELKAGNTY
jgi:hypothetical protein